MSVLLEFSMTPIGKGEGVSKYVSRSIDIISKSGLEYRANPMGTVIEGDWDEAFAVVKKCFQRMQKDCNRISTNVKIDYRKGAKHRITGKIESVEKRLGRKVKK
ncbi:MAG: MTH1187 family thiamine-binding protein [Deltaproteobacteria bacterium]|nr:MTH1187 family thiamine-binding protein [Deltaproteobacteria bacterium]